VNIWHTWKLLLIMPLWVAGCAAVVPSPFFVQTPRPLTQPGLAIELNGFSVVAPKSKNWNLEQGSARIVFGKLLQPDESLGPDGRTRVTPRSVIVGFALAPAPLINNALTSDDVYRAAERHMTGQEWSGRQRAVEQKITPFQQHGTDCARYESVLEEQNNPRWPGAEFKIAATGFVCRHPFAPGRLFHAHFSERRLLRGKDRPDETHRSESEATLSSVVFAPLR